MTGHQFYEYCRDHRQIEPDVHKREALQEVYKFMRECSYTPANITTYISRRISVEARKRNQEKVDALAWLHDVFAGKVATGPEQTGSLWSEA